MKKKDEEPGLADMALVLNYFALCSRPALAARIKKANPKAYSEFMRQGKSEVERIAKLAAKEKRGGS